MGPGRDEAEGGNGGDDRPSGLQLGACRNG